MPTTTPWDGATLALDLNGQDDWERVYVAGVALPGRATVRGRGGLKVDVKHAPERNGATLTHLGREPATFEITLELWTEVHLVDFEALIPTVLPDGRRRVPKPVDVAHPGINLLGAKSLYFTSVGQPQPARPGVWEVNLSAVEWRPPTPSEAKTLQGSQRDLKLTDILTALITPTPRDEKPSATATDP